MVMSRTLDIELTAIAEAGLFQKLRISASVAKGQSHRNKAAKSILSEKSTNTTMQSTPAKEPIISGRERSPVISNCERRPFQLTTR